MTRSFETQIYIDGAPRTFLVQRLTKEAAITYRAKTMQLAQRGQRRTALKDEAKADDAAYEKHLEAELDEELQAVKFYADSIVQFVTVKPGELVDDDGQAILTGEDIVRQYGNELEVLTQITSAILLENTLSAEQKKTWKARRVSARGRKRPGDAVPSGSEATAGAASPTGTEPSAGATASPAIAPSGPKVH